MPLLNYTTKVPVEKSVQDITKSLVKAGASSIMQDYDETGQVVAVSFRIMLEGNPINFRLPADWRSTQQVLKNDRVRYEEPHARRVAWRITKDWVEAQMALLATKSVVLPQLFLPYAVDDRGVTLFEKIAADPKMLLGDGR
ncbi:hypothetical protein [Dietzia sp. MNB45]|uniref:hypothetical protein n=1 Tax=Dietzia sp. MNB45 TaxID=3238800 RepID=UPI003F7FD8B2